MIEVLRFLHLIIYIVYIYIFDIILYYIDNSTSIPFLPQFKKYKYKAIELIHSTLRNMVKKDYSVSDTMNKLQNSLSLLLQAEKGGNININEIVPFDIEGILYVFIYIIRIKIFI